MTVAVDMKTGKVIGQVTTAGPTSPKAVPGRDLWLLTKDGYQCVLAARVRLEKV